MIWRKQLFLKHLIILTVNFFCETTMTIRLLWQAWMFLKVYILSVWLLVIQLISKRWKAKGTFTVLIYLAEVVFEGLDCFDGTNQLSRSSLDIFLNKKVRLCERKRLAARAARPGPLSWLWGAHILTGWGGGGANPILARGRGDPLGAGILEHVV